MPTALSTTAIVLQAPERLSLQQLALSAPEAGDVVVDVDFSAISTGTERLLWTGRMPSFPGMGYPLIPGYESVGRVVDAGPDARDRIGQNVFVPGARCYGDVRGLFGGSASRVVLPSARAATIKSDLGRDGVLLALAATAYHALAAHDAVLPDVIVGHGVLGRLMARIAVCLGASPIVWETNAARAPGALGYKVVHPDADERRDYRAIYDVSGDGKLLDTLIGRIAKGGQIVLAGFYDQPLSFAFPPAFMREARLRVAAEWQGDDLNAVLALIEHGQLDLSGLVTRTQGADTADQAYRTAFGDPDCLKMVLDWRNIA